MGQDCCDMGGQVQFILQAGKRVHEQLVVNEARKLGRMLGNELSLSQFQMVRLVYRLKQAGIKELAMHLDVAAPSASAMVDRLVERGILDREQSREDRRRVEVRVAPAAARQVKKVEDAIRNNLERLAERIGPAMTRRWYQVMCEIDAVLEGDK